MKKVHKGKDVRRPYSGSRAFDKSCRCHGGCEWCQSNRTHKNNKRIESIKDQEKDV